MRHSSPGYNNIDKGDNSINHAALRVCAYHQLLPLSSKALGLVRWTKFGPGRGGAHFQPQPSQPGSGCPNQTHA